MNGLRAVLSVMVTLALLADVALVLALLKLLPWRATSKFAAIASLVCTAGSAILGLWSHAGVFAMSSAFAVFYWWKHRNDDDDDDTKRRRRRVAETLKSWLPRPKAFARPVPAQS